MFSRKIGLKPNANVLFRRCSPGAVSVRGSEKTRRRAARGSLSNPQKDCSPAPVALQNITMLENGTRPQVSSREEGRQGSHLLGAFPLTVSQGSELIPTHLSHAGSPIPTVSFFGSCNLHRSAAFNLGWGAQSCWEPASTC